MMLRTQMKFRRMDFDPSPSQASELLETACILYFTLL